MLKEIKVGDLVRFTTEMPGIVTTKENSLVIASKTKPYLVTEVTLGSWKDSCGYDYVVFDGKDRIICMEGDIEPIQE
jgi:hypothetical protein